MADSEDKHNRQKERVDPHDQADAFIDAWEKDALNGLGIGATPADMLRWWADLWDGATQDPVRDASRYGAPSRGNTRLPAPESETLAIALGQCLERLERIADRLDAVERRLADLEDDRNS